MFRVKLDDNAYDFHVDVTFDSWTVGLQLAEKIEGDLASSINIVCLHNFLFDPFQQPYGFEGETIEIWNDDKLISEPLEFVKELYNSFNF